MMFLATLANGHSVSEDRNIDSPSLSHNGVQDEVGVNSLYQSVPDVAAKHLVRIFKLLADESRLKILSYLLQAGELNVRALCDLLDQSQPAVSHHLALLKSCGLIEARRDGKNNFYRVIPEQFGRFAEILFREVPGLQEDKIDLGETSIRLESEPEPVGMA